MCAAVTLTHAHMYITMLLAEEVSLSCPLLPFAGLFKSEVRDGSYHKKTSNWHTQGNKMLGFLSVWKEGQMETELYIQKIIYYNKCVLQCLDMSVRENEGCEFSTSTEQNSKF